VSNIFLDAGSKVVMSCALVFEKKVFGQGVNNRINGGIILGE
jgi:hypothetical protein